MPALETFDSIPSISAADARLINRAVRNLQTWWQLDSWQTHMRKLMGCPVNITKQPLKVVSPQDLANRFPPNLFAAILCSRPEGNAKIAVEFELHLAAWIIDRLLGAETELVMTNRMTPFNETEQGVLAYFVSRMLVESKLKAWKLHSLATQTETIKALCNGETWFIWPLHIQCGEGEGYARVCCPRASLEYCTSLVSKPPTPGSDTQVPIELVLQLPTFALPARDIASVRPGDIVTFGQPTTATEASTLWSAPLQLFLVGNPSYTWTALYKGNGELVVTAVAEGESMSETSIKSAQPTSIDLEQLRDTPVTLSVELGRFRLSLQDVGQLMPGQLVQTGLTLGAEVTVKAGDKAVAFGELVNVDGELGIKITRV